MVIDPAYLLAVLVIELTPGPNMAWLALLCAMEGRRAGLAAVMGVALGLVALGLVAVTGIMPLLLTSPAWMQALRWTGLIYMLWLAWDSWPKAPVIRTHSIGMPGSNFRHFRRGVVINLLNIKSALFFITIIPDFIDPRRAAMPQFIMLIGISVAIATAVHLMIVALAGEGHKWLSAPGRSANMQRIFAGLLVVIALWIFWRSR